jgi:uroporphyrinogen-III synthase
MVNSQKKVLLVRGTGNERDEEALSSQRISCVTSPFIEMRPADLKNSKQLYDLVTDSSGWFILTSANALNFWSEHIGFEKIHSLFAGNTNLKFAAVGQSSASALKNFGASNILTPNPQSSKALLDLLILQVPTRAFIPCSNIANPQLNEGLEANGWDVFPCVTYFNEMVHDEPAGVDLIRRGEIAVVLLRSPSAAIALHGFVPDVHVPVICGGNLTASKARELGLNIVGISEDPTPLALATLVSQVLEEK